MSAEALAEDGFFIEGSSVQDTNEKKKTRDDNQGVSDNEEEVNPNASIDDDQVYKRILLSNSPQNVISNLERKLDDFNRSMVGLEERLYELKQSYKNRDFTKFKLFIQIDC